MNSFNQNQMRLESLVKLIERFLPLQSWGFKQSVQFMGTTRPDIIFGNGHYPTVIYDSEYCRVKFLLDYEDHHDWMGVYYGRLHAPDDEKLIKFNDIDYHCWHGNVYNLVLKFLDGDTPQEAVWRKGNPPQGFKDFKYTWGKDVDYQPEWAARIHSSFWSYYGKRLFELFDIRHPELWAQYTQFVQEFYEIDGRLPNVIPSLDKIY